MTSGKCSISSFCNLGYCLSVVYLTSGKISRLSNFAFQAQDMVDRAMDHSSQINDIQLSKDMAMCITASKDHTAKVRSNLWIRKITVNPVFEAVPVFEAALWV